MWFTRTLSNTMDEKRRDARLLASTSHAPGGADLSGGQQQRAAIAHAGAGAELLIAD
jgi:ABC-type lipoprotein export system ATPase subunit